LDVNHDGTTTLHDMTLLLRSLFFYPGDFILKYVVGTELGKFLELSAEDYGGYTSGTLSFFCYFMVFAIMSQIRDDLKRGFSEISKRKSSKKDLKKL